MHLLNYSHPLTDDQRHQIEGLINQPIAEVCHIPVQFDLSAPFAEQAVGLADQANLTAEQWQTEPLALLLPALNFGAAALLAELHGRCGYFPPIVRLRPVKDAVPPRFEVAEIINLQSIREMARERRG